MSIPIRIVDGAGKVASLNGHGELVVSRGTYDTSSYVELGVAAQGYTFFGPRVGQQFIITAILMFGDFEVSSVANATVELYEATEENSAIVYKNIVTVEVGRNQSIPFPPLRFAVTEGMYVNGKTDDDDVHVTIFGNYCVCR